MVTLWDFIHLTDLSPHNSLLPPPPPPPAPHYTNKLYLLLKGFTLLPCSCTAFSQALKVNSLWRVIRFGHVSISSKESSGSLSAAGRPKRLWENGHFYFLIVCSSIGIPDFWNSNCPKNSIAQSLAWQPSADQGARGLWLQDW